MSRRKIIPPLALVAATFAFGACSDTTAPTEIDYEFTQPAPPQNVASGRAEMNSNASGRIECSETAAGSLHWGQSTRTRRWGSWPKLWGWNFPIPG